MPVYQPTMRYQEAAFREGGIHRMHNDAEALEFLSRVVRNLMQTGGDQYAGCFMDIADGERIVGSVSCKITAAALN